MDIFISIFLFKVPLAKVFHHWKELLLTIYIYFHSILCSILLRSASFLLEKQLNCNLTLYKANLIIFLRIGCIEQFFELSFLFLRFPKLQHCKKSLFWNHIIYTLLPIQLLCISINFVVFKIWCNYWEQLQLFILLLCSQRHLESVFSFPHKNWPRKFAYFYLSKQFHTNQVIHTCNICQQSNF